MPEHPTTHRRTAIVTTVGVLSAVYAVTFLFGALLHLGWKIPLGFAVLDEPRILPATIVESLCALALAVAAFVVLTRRGWAWTIAVAAHAFALGGVLLWMAALAVGAGPSHRTKHDLPSLHARGACGGLDAVALAHRKGARSVARRGL